MTFGITVNTFVRMCGINVLGHICNEYSVLVSKPGLKTVIHCCIKEPRKLAMLFDHVGW
jgi:hypothetical protein